MTTFNKYFLERICKLTNNTTKEVVSCKQFNHFIKQDNCIQTDTKQIDRNTYNSISLYYELSDKNYYYKLTHECTTL